MVLPLFLVHQFSAESVNESAFLVFDLVGGDADLEVKRGTRNCIDPNLMTGRKTVGLVVGEKN